jgi:hypothetical protein
MTVSDLLEELWEALGEPTDLDPYTAGSIDVTTDGSVKMIRWLNAAYRKIANWRFKDGTFLRFGTQRATINFQMPLESGICQSGSTTVAILPSAFATANDFYNDWLIQVESGAAADEKRYIVDYAGSTQAATVNRAFSENITAGSHVSVVKRFAEFVASGGPSASVNIVLDPVNTFVQAMRVTDLEDLDRLSLADAVENYAGDLESVGTPEQYYFDGKRIYFDVAVSDQRWYKVDYIREVQDLAGAADEPDIPERWHEGILLRAIWWGQRRNQDFRDAYSTKRDLVDFMESTKRNLEEGFDHQELGTVVVDPMGGSR